MKTLRILTLFIFCFFYTYSFSQVKTHEIDVKDPASSKLSLIGLAGDILITGNNSNKITITANGIKPKPKQAEGLKRVGSGGTDNTGIGANQRSIGSNIILTGAIPMSSETQYKVSIPENMKLNIELSIFSSGDVIIKGLNSDIEADVKNSNIKLIDITGPTIINNLSGDINIEYSKLNQSSPFSIKAISGDIDISMPENTPANLEFRCMSGGIYTDFDIETNNQKAGSLKHVGGGSKVHSLINGGGVKFVVSAISGNIYLRKKE